MVYYLGQSLAVILGSNMKNEVKIRAATNGDREFIFGLSPRLAEVANLTWHADNDVQTMQDEYISTCLDQKKFPYATLIAEKDGCPLGFIHVCAHKDSISGEACGTVPLLAVSPTAQGMGIGQRLMASAELWATKQGYRLLHLEVFANNDKVIAVCNMATA